MLGRAHSGRGAACCQDSSDASQDDRCSIPLHRARKGKDPYRYVLHLAAIAQVLLHPQLDNLMWLFHVLYLYWAFQMIWR